MHDQNTLVLSLSLLPVSYNYRLACKGLANGPRTHR